MADFDQTLPAALAEANALDYDYNDGNGVDFEPYSEFQSADETASWIRAWTGNAELDGAEYRIFGEDGSGGYAAFWLVRSGRPLEQQPIVFFGSEGELGVVARNLDDYLWLLSGGFGPFEAVRDPDTDRELNMEIAELAARYAPAAEKPAREASGSRTRSSRTSSKRSAPIVEEKKPACRPRQDLQSVATPRQEHIEVTAVEIMAALHHDRAQAVDRLPEVNGSRGAIDPDRRWQRDHGSSEALYERDDIVEVGGHRHAQPHAGLELDLDDAVCVASVPRRRRGRGYHAHWNQGHAGLPLPTQLGDPPLQRRQRDAASLREALLRQLASLELGNRRDPELTSATHRTGEDRLRAREPPCALPRTDT
jgi:hypothetical protein